MTGYYARLNKTDLAHLLIKPEPESPSKQQIAHDPRDMRDEPEREPERNGRNLAAALRACMAERRFEGQLLVVLDQFEEFFQYAQHPAQKEAAASFEQQLPGLVENDDLPVNFLFSVREDSVALVDRFKGSIPHLFENTLKVEHLSPDEARKAIIKPLEEFQKNRNGVEGPTALDPEDPKLAGWVADEIVREQEKLERAGSARVQAPYLQLVMSRWWKKEKEKGSPALRRSTLTTDLGGVGKIAENHFTETIDALEPDERDLAAEMFGPMVTATGRKIALTVSEIPGSDRDRPLVEGILGKLYEERILATPPAPPGSHEGEACYEFAHDVLARAALDWRKDQEQEKRLAAKETQLRFSRRVSAIALTVAIFAALLATYAVYLRGRALESERQASARELAAYAVDSLSRDPERSILLGMHAVGATFSADGTVVPAAENVLHRAILMSQVRLTLRGHEGSVRDVAFSPDGARLATASDDGTAKLWGAASGEELLTLRGHEGSVRDVAFSPDGARLATASWDGTAKLWGAASGEELLTLRGHESIVWGVAFSPDGARLATASRDSTAKLWDAASGEELLTLRGHESFVNGVAFSPDGARLATVGADGTVQVYAMRIEDLLSLARSRLTRDLTPEECRRYLHVAECPPLP